MNLSEIIGYLATFFLVITLIPQLFHTIKTKKVDDISYIFITLQIITCLLFLTYGIMIYKNPLIIANSIVLFQVILFLGLKLKYS